MEGRAVTLLELEELCNLINCGKAMPPEKFPTKEILALIEDWKQLRAALKLYEYVAVNKGETRYSDAAEALAASDARMARLGGGK